MSPAEIKFWRDRTEAADARGYFDAEDYGDAASWQSCAIGEQHQKFPKVVLLKAGWEEPRDEVLLRLGLVFNNAVASSWYSHRDGMSFPYHILDAYETLDLIEARVMVLRGRAA